MLTYCSNINCYWKTGFTDKMIKIHFASTLQFSCLTRPESAHFMWENTEKCGTSFGTE